MNKEDLYKDIETQLMNNRAWIHSRSLTTGFNSEYFKDYLRMNNNLLDKVKSYLNTHDETKEYERGVQECCEAIIKIVNSISDGGISIAELERIFDTSYGYSGRFINKLAKTIGPLEIVNKIKEYEESQNFKIGDIVRVESDKGLFGIVVAIDETEKKAKVLWQDFSYRTSEWLLADLAKTGKHVDIQVFVEKEMGEE